MRMSVLLLGACFLLMTFVGRSPAVVLFEETFDTDTTIENFADTYPELEIFNEPCMFPGLCDGTFGTAEVIDGKVRFLIHNISPLRVYATLNTKAYFKPSEGKKLRMSMETMSFGSPGNYTLGLAAMGNGENIDLDFMGWPGFNNPSGRCAKLGLSAKGCAGLGQIAVKDGTSRSSRNYEGGLGSESILPFSYSQTWNVWHQFIVEWDGGRTWEFTLKSGDNPDDVFTATYLHHPFLPAPEWVQGGFSNGGNPSPSRGCGTSFLCESYYDNLLIEEISTAMLGDVNGDGAVDNLDITPFVTALSAADEAAFVALFSEGNYAAADIDMSGHPDNLDITPFIGLLTTAGNESAVVPEPAAALLLCLPLMARAWCRSRLGSFNMQ